MPKKFKNEEEKSAYFSKIGSLPRPGSKHGYFKKLKEQGKYSELLEISKKGIEARKK